MTKTTNLQPASVRARLQDLQRRLFPNIPPNQMLLLYAQQGFLARLDASEYAEHFVLKGALSLFVRYREAARPTEDIDLAGHGLGQSPDQIAAAMREVCGVPFADGLQFDPQSVTVRPINAALKYPGTAVTVRADLGSSRTVLQLDISFGNAITPEAARFTFPALLLDPAVGVSIYPLETVITEKFAALAEIGAATTRMKDLYDLQVILGRETFEAATVGRALQRSFAARGTPRIGVEEVLALDFDADDVLAGRWQQYLRRTRFAAPPFGEVMDVIRHFYGPLLLEGLAQGRWTAGQWRREE
ncbi:nucleotidyl transferase AbiEii/AbiGii toxin family protein [Deinococcus oregonensis]|uniref:Nucleotidyl transferase AbiEii/AbiGii toxin family protein n=1 Tax=Deinococcus oregonensis TaxID=1805970 RepID=A0ABV6AYU7_9DEIO